jgi:hypothetical protein
VQYRLGPRQFEQNGGLRVAVSADARKCVVFFGKLVPPKDRSSIESSEIEYGGTGFLAGIEDEGFKFHYLVTCRHVAKHLEEDFFIRANTTAGGVEALPINGDEASWQYHPDPSVDVATTAIGLNALHFDHLALPLSMAVNRTQISCGDQIHIVGLFRLHYGKERNVPIVHTGHIAALPDPEEKAPIRDRITGKLGYAESYLVEAQTLEGLSGSPVFVQQTTKIGEGRIGNSTVNIGALGRMTLLGIYQGAWDAEPGIILAADRNFRGNVRVPLGMGTVVPIERAIELIQGNEKLKKTREMLKEKKRAAQVAAVTDSAFSPPATDANPKHREDFERLLGKAAKPRTD